MKKRVISLLLVLAMLMSMAVFAVEAEDATPEQIAAVLDEIEKGERVAAEAAAMEFPTKENAPGDDVGYAAVCPVCGEEKMWLARSADTDAGTIYVGSGAHYYLVEDINYVQVTSTGGACLNLNGHNITRTSGPAIWSTNNGSLNIMGEGEVSGNYTADSYATINIYYQSNVTLNLYGGTFKKAEGNNKPVLALGYSSTSGSVVNMYAGATIDGTGPASTYTGGVRLDRSGVFNMYGGKIVNGTGNNVGGNMYVNGGILNMYAGQISGGTDSKGNRDVYVTAESASEGTVPGTINLAGKPVIGYLYLPYAINVNIVGPMQDGASVGVASTSNRTLASGKGVYAKYFYGALAGSSVLAGNSGNLNYSHNILTSATDGGTKEVYCPVCDKWVNWVKAPDSGEFWSGAAHCYLAADRTSTVFLYNSTGCFNLNGKNITVANSHAIYIYNNANWNIMGSGQVSGNKTDETFATFNGKYTENWTLNLYGGTYKKASTNAKPVIELGNKAGHTVNMYNGAVIDAAGAYNSSYYGGVMMLATNSSTFHMYGGQIINSAPETMNGGNVKVGGGTFTMDNGTISGGYSSAWGNAGNVRVSGATFIMNGGTISGGTGDAGAQGNFGLTSGTCTMHNGTISGGKSNGYGGGNVGILGGTFTMNDGSIINGNAAQTGGNVRVSDAASAKFVMNGGTVKGGKATNDGGNIYLTTGSSTELKGGTVDGNICAYNGTVKVSGTANITDFIYLADSGKAEISGGTVDSTIRYPSLDKITVSNGYEIYDRGGNRAVVASADIASFGPGQLSENGLSLDAAMGAVTGLKDLKLEILDGEGNVLATTTPTKAFIEATLTGAALDGLTVSTLLGGTSADWNTVGELTAETEPATMKLYVNGMKTYILTCDVDLGETAWTDVFKVRNETTGEIYVSLQEALDTATEGDELSIENAVTNEVVKIKNSVTLNVAADITANVDLNGKTVTVTGDGIVNFADTSGDDYTFPTGKVINQTGEDLPMDVTANNKRYLALVDDAGDYTYHRVEIKLTALTLNVDTGKMYYKASISAGQALSEAVDEFGISYSLAGMPGAGGEDEVTAVMSGKLGVGTVAYSAYITDIVKVGEDNIARGEKAIYANPYLVIGSRVVMADVTYGDQLGDDGFNGVAKSLKDLVQYFYTAAPSSGVSPYDGLDETRKGLLDNFCQTYGLNAWKNN